MPEFLAPRIHIVCGKGGVGKTTVAAALALVAARAGYKVCVAEVDHKGSLPHLFGASEPSYEPSEMSPGVWALNILPDAALAEYLEVQYHMKRVSKILTSTHFTDYITTAAPGLEDILVLGKIWYLEQNRAPGGRRYDFDVIIIDAPAAGHMVSFLAAPLGLADAVQVGPVKRQADWLADMLTNPARSVAHLVTLPEEMPVVETLETSQKLDEELHIPQGVTFANGVYENPLTEEHLAFLSKRSAVRSCADSVELRLDNEDLEALDRYASFIEARSSIQAKHLRVLAKGASRPIVKLPHLFTSGLELPDVETLADEIEKELHKL
jgi:anion-transporting  ArsA/GET3 family ATPase